MKPELVKAAAEVITNQQILVNMVSRRVRQLCRGHRPLVEYAPGLGHADIALPRLPTSSWLTSLPSAKMGTALQLRKWCNFPVLSSRKRRRKKPRDRGYAALTFLTLPNNGM